MIRPQAPAREAQDRMSCSVEDREDGSAGVRGGSTQLIRSHVPGLCQDATGAMAGVPSKEPGHRGTLWKVEPQLKGQKPNLWLYFPK
jgi:hypothetical protein